MYGAEHIQQTRAKYRQAVIGNLSSGENKGMKINRGFRIDMPTYRQPVRVHPVSHTIYLFLRINLEHIKSTEKVYIQIDLTVFRVIQYTMNFP